MSSLRMGRVPALVVSAALGLTVASTLAAPTLTAIAVADDAGGQQQGLLGLFPQHQYGGSGDASSNVAARGCDGAATNAWSSDGHASSGSQGQTTLLGWSSQQQTGTYRSSSAAGTQQCQSHSSGQSAASQSQQQSAAFGLYQQRQGGTTQAASGATATCETNEGASSETQSESFTSAQQQGGFLGLSPQQQYVTQASSSSTARACGGKGAGGNTASNSSGGQQQAGLLGTSYSQDESPPHGCLALGKDVIGVCLVGGQAQDPGTGEQQQCAVGTFDGADADEGWEICLIGAQRQGRTDVSYQDSCMLFARRDPRGASCAIGRQYQEGPGPKTPGGQDRQVGQQQSGLLGAQQQGPAGQQQSGLLGLYHQQQRGTG